jgi:DNA-binding CsgD family transcriptional regulator
MESGEFAQAQAWLARAERALSNAGQPCAATGLVRVPAGLGLLDDGQPEAALSLFEEVAALGDELHDADVAALGRLGAGQALVRLSRTREASRLLDDSMLSVVTGEVSPLAAGIIYCAVILACHEMLDMARAQEWTDALDRWCNSQADLVPFKGSCEVFRAELFQFQGSWTKALDLAIEAEARLSQPRMNPAVGTALYRQGELFRLTGRLSEAEGAYSRAEQWGYQPEPGRARLRLVQGRIGAAVAAIRHVLEETQGDGLRVPLLAAASEIFLAANDHEAADEVSGELSRVAALLGAPLALAEARRARGALALAGGNPREASAELIGALQDWSNLGAPYEVARTRALLSRAAHALGDEEVATAHLRQARAEFERLTAASDLRGLDTTDLQGSGQDAHGLTPREVEILQLIATGLTNRAIAVNLTISEKTAANHVGNILGKLMLSSRAAATAFAYEHGYIQTTSPG